MNYEHKYRKYKAKYLRSKQTSYNMFGGASGLIDPEVLKRDLNNLTFVVTLLPDYENNKSKINEMLSQTSKDFRQSGQADLSTLADFLDLAKTGQVNISEAIAKLNSLIPLLKKKEALVSKAQNLIQTQKNLNDQLEETLGPKLVEKLKNIKQQAQYTIQHPETIKQSDAYKTLAQASQQAQQALQNPNALPDVLDEFGRKIPQLADEYQKQAIELASKINKMAPSVKAIQDNVQKISLQLQQSPASEQSQTGAMSILKSTEPVPY